MAASSALTAYKRSFAAGLFEAATQCAADDEPVLLVACDVQAVGALASVTASEGLLAVAVVVAPWRGERDGEVDGGRDGEKDGKRDGESGASSASGVSTQAHGDIPFGRCAFIASLVAGPAAAPALRSEAARSLAGNAMADALPFMEAMALGSNAALSLPLSTRLALRLVPATETSRPALTSPPR